MTKQVADFTVSFEKLQRTKIFRESAADGRELNRYLTTLVEGKPLAPTDINNLFLGIEQGMSGAGINKTLLGRAGDVVGKVGAKIAGLGKALKDTTVVQGVDDTWADIKNTLSAKIGKDPKGAAILSSIDKYQQLVKKYPTTSKFFWNAAAVVGGLMSGGLAVPALLAATKGIDSLIQGKEFSSAVGDAIAQGGKTAGVMGAKNLAVAGAHAASNAVQGISDFAHSTADSISNTFHNATGGGTAPVTGTEGGTTPPVTGTEGAAPTGGEAYTTVAGDQLGKIAQAHNTTTQAIINANPNVAAALKAAANGKDMPIGLQMNIPTGSAPAGTNPFAGNTHFKMNESAELYEAAIAAIGFTYTKLPRSQMVDRETTIRKWALNEGLGRPVRKSVYLNEDGVNTVFYNLDKLHGIILEAAVGNKLLDKVEGGLNKAGNWLSGKWKSATTKFEANRAKRRLRDAGISNDSDEIAKFLVGEKVPFEIISAVYKQLGFPAPSNTGAEADGYKPSGLYQADDLTGLTGNPDTTAAGTSGADTTNAATGATGGATALASQAGSSKQEQKAAQDIDRDIDDLIRSLRRVDNMHQPAYVKYIRDALDRTFGKAEQAAPVAAPASGAVNQNPTTIPGEEGSTASQGGGLKKAAESRRYYKGRYIKEAQSKKLAREFEAFVAGQE